MEEKPRRRWFRFQLSTVLILTAIVAWIMVTRPRVGLVYWSAPTVYELVVGYIPEIDDEYWTFEASSWTSTTKQGLNIYIGPNPQLAWPVLALLAFLAWKAAWALVERRRARRATLR